MRTALGLAAIAAILLIAAPGRCQQQGQTQQTSSSSSSTAQPPQDSLAAAARRAREQKKDAPKPAKVFDNDNMPTAGGVSMVGVAPAAPSADNPDSATAATTGAPVGAAATPNDEKAWRERFDNLRKKQQQDEEELSLLQRELGVLDVQAYTDPMKGMQQGLTRSDINAKTAKIDAKKKQVEADKQAISDAEDALRRSGGDIGWAR